MPLSSRAESIGRWRLGLWALCLVAGFAAVAAACSVPVFRYALERWEPDVYPVVIFHRGPLDAEAQQAVDLLTDAGREGTGYANALVRAVDLEADDVPEPALRMWEAQQVDTLPWMVASYPPHAGVPGSPYSGAATREAAEQLLDSPLRREVATRLLAGETAVWVLLESGDAAADDAAAEMVATELARLEKSLKLPEITLEDQLLLTDAGPALKIKFSTLRLSRNDPTEQFLVQMLLGTESDLATFHEPMVFPVFGQGRAYFALVGAGIDERNIEQIGTFLVGECSCEVKSQNPGTDLLMTANWHSLGELFVHDEELPPLVGLPASMAVTRQAAEPTDDPTTDNSATALSPADLSPAERAALEDPDIVFHRIQLPVGPPIEYTTYPNSSSGTWSVIYGVGATLAVTFLLIVGMSVWWTSKKRRMT